MITESWRDIPGYEGLYQASNLGNIRSLARKVATKCGYRISPGKSIAFNENRRGYRSVNLCSNGMRSKLYVHRLVLLAFVGKPDENMDCCHFDSDPRNNRLENLRWDTRANNHLDKIRAGTNQFGESNKSSKLKINDVIEIRRQLSEGKSGVKISHAFGVSDSAIYAIKHRKAWASA